MSALAFGAAEGESCRYSCISSWTSTSPLLSVLSGFLCPPACQKGWEPRKGGQPCICAGWAADATEPCAVVPSSQQGAGRPKVVQLAGNLPRAGAADGWFWAAGHARGCTVREMCSRFTPPSPPSSVAVLQPSKDLGFWWSKRLVLSQQGCRHPGGRWNPAPVNTAWAGNGVMAAVFTFLRGQDEEWEVSCTPDSWCQTSCLCKPVFARSLLQRWGIQEGPGEAWQPGDYLCANVWV